MLLEGAIKPFERRSTAARMWRPGSSLMSGGHRFHLHCAGSGTPTSFSNQGGRNGRLLGMDFDGSHATRGYACTIAPAVVGVIRLLPSKTA